MPDAEHDPAKPASAPSGEAQESGVGCVGEREAVEAFLDAKPDWSPGCEWAIDEIEAGVRAVLAVAGAERRLPDPSPVAVPVVREEEPLCDFNEAAWMAACREFGAYGSRGVEAFEAGLRAFLAEHASAGSDDTVSGEAPVSGAGGVVPAEREEAEEIERLADAYARSDDLRDGRIVEVDEADSAGFCLTSTVRGTVCSRGGIGCPIDHSRYELLPKAKPEGSSAGLLVRGEE